MKAGGPSIRARTQSLAVPALASAASAGLGEALGTTAFDEEALDGDSISDSAKVLEIRPLKHLPLLTCFPGCGQVAAN